MRRDDPFWSTVEGMRSSTVTVFLLLSASAAIAQPVVTAIQNSASNIPAGLPNAGVAEGSLFIVKGSDMGGATFTIASSFPLQTTIAGTSVLVTMNGVSTAAWMYYSGASQLAAILPSSVPAGSGTLTVTYNGQTSQPFPITVVQNAFGVFTVHQNGTGDAIAFLNADSTLITAVNAANPGDVVAFWGTGLGPVKFDESGAAQQFDMTDVPVEVMVADKQAQVLFRGRNACCAAVDVVYISIPAGVSGCAAPVVFKIGNVVSNTSTIAIASSGRVCSPTNPTITSTQIETFVAKGGFRQGSVVLQRKRNIFASRRDRGPKCASGDKPVR